MSLIGPTDLVRSVWGRSGEEKLHADESQKQGLSIKKKQSTAVARIFGWTARGNMTQEAADWRDDIHILD